MFVILVFTHIWFLWECGLFSVILNIFRVSYETCDLGLRPSPAGLGNRRPEQSLELHGCALPCVPYFTSSSHLWRGVCVGARKISKFGQICGFWPRRGDIMHRSWWSLACMIFRALLGEVVWVLEAPNITRGMFSCSVGFAASRRRLRFLVHNFIGERWNSTKYIIDKL